MSEWRWIDQGTLILLHDESLAEHGGSAGLRDEGLLWSALARPRDLVAHEEPDVADLAAAYGVELAKNHPLIDGSKHAAFLSVGLFLALNGKRLVTTQAEATLMMQDVASSAIDEPGFAGWFRGHLEVRNN